MHREVQVLLVLKVLQVPLVLREHKVIKVQQEAQVLLVLRVLQVLLVLREHKVIKVILDREDRLVLKVLKETLVVLHFIILLNLILQMQIQVQEI